MWWWGCQPLANEWVTSVTRMNPVIPWRSIRRRHRAGLDHLAPRRHPVVERRQRPLVPGVGVGERHEHRTAAAFEVEAQDGADLLSPAGPDLGGAVTARPR